MIAHLMAESTQRAVRHKEVREHVLVGYSRDDELPDYDAFWFVSHDIVIRPEGKTDIFGGVLPIDAERKDIGDRDQFDERHFHRILPDLVDDQGLYPSQSHIPNTVLSHKDYGNNRPYRAAKPLNQHFPRASAPAHNSNPEFLAALIASWCAVGFVVWLLVTTFPFSKPVSPDAGLGEPAQSPDNARLATSFNGRFNIEEPK